MKLIVLYYLVIINFIGFIIMGYDKRRAIKNKWRVPEKSLMSVSLIGGSVGMLLGMKFFRHKTKHKLFTIGVPLILIIEVLVISYFKVII